MKRLLAIAALASATTYGIMAETGMASHESRYVSVRPGTYVPTLLLSGAETAR
jgi:hypothetical protein